MRNAMWVAAILVVTAGVSLAQTPGQLIQRRAAALRGARGPNTVQLLNQRIPEVSFSEAPLEQVIGWLGEFTNFNVIVRWENLEEMGIDRDRPISLTVRNLRLTQVLWMILNEAAGTDIRLAYRASGNLLIISTEDDLGREMITRVYDISDLLVVVPRFTNAPVLDPGQALQQVAQAAQAGGGGFGGGGGGGAGGGQLFQGGQQQQQEDNTQGGEQLIQQIIQLITQTVEPDSWAENGGRGTIVSFNRLLVVHNTPLVHQQIGGYIEGAD